MKDKDTMIDLRVSDWMGDEAEARQWLKTETPYVIQQGWDWLDERVARLSALLDRAREYVR